MVLTQKTLLIVAYLLAFGLVLWGLAGVAHATGDDADRMCDPVYPQCKCGEDPDPATGKCMPGGKNKFMCPPGPQVCFDTTNGHTTTGTCDRPLHCLTNTCGGSECKQVDPKQFQQPSQQPGQGGQGQGGQMPQLPQPPQGGGGGGEQSQQPQQSSREDCTVSSAFGIPCPNPVSAQLDTAQSSSEREIEGIFSDVTAEGQSDSATTGSSDGATEASSGALTKISDGLSSIWRRITGQAVPEGASAGSDSAETNAYVSSNNTFAPPPSLPSSYTPEQRSGWVSDVIGWFRGLF